VNQVASTRWKKARSGIPIWEIEEQYQLPILAVCFTAMEISILAQGSIKHKSINSCFVERMEVLIPLIKKNRTLAAEVQSRLDNKYRLVIGRFDEAICEADVERVWTSYWETGKFRGAFWAIMRNGQLSVKFKEKILRQVEIASFQNCCAFLKEKRSNCNLQKKIEVRDIQSAELELKYQKERCHYCQQIRELRSELSLKDYKMNKLERHLALFQKTKHQSADLS